VGRSKALEDERNWDTNCRDCQSLILSTPEKTLEMILKAALKKTLEGSLDNSNGYRRSLPPFSILAFLDRPRSRLP